MVNFLIILMNAIIVNYKGGRHTQTGNQMIVQSAECSDKEQAAGFVGKTVVWKTPSGREIKGEVRSAHGNSGALRVLFETGMPGQSIGQTVTVN